MLLPLLLFLLLPTVAPAQRSGAASLRADLRDIVAAANGDGARRGVIVVSLDRGDTLFAEAADAPLAPASNLKLYTTAAALAYLDARFRWSTYLLAAGPVEGAALRGDVVLYGTGDPAVSARMGTSAAATFAALADSLRAAGVRRVEGDVVADGSFFGAEGIGIGWNPADFDQWYAARSSSVTADENVGPTRVPLRTPTLHAAALLREALTGAGIAVAGRAVARFDATASPAAFESPAARRARPVHIIAIHRSPTVAEIARVTNHVSHNFYADAMLKTLGRVAGAEGTFAAGQHVVRRIVAEAGADSTLLRMEDGSGLSRLDRVTPRMTVALLAWMARGPYAEAFAASLPVAATREGLTSRMRGSAAAGNLRAKTGTIAHVSALSGYVTGAAGERLAFSIIANDVADVHRAKQFEDRIGARLAEFRR